MIDHGFLWKILTKCGVLNSLIQAISWTYNCAKSRIEINRYLSDPINLEKGVRQGDLLFCLLFNAVIKPLAILIKECKQLPRLTDKGRRIHKVSMYVDDTAVFLIHLREFRVLIKLYVLYNQATGG